MSASEKKVISFDNCAFSPKRENLADFLTEYLVEEKDGFVLNLNGSWGVGKTYFLKSWEKKLSGQYPVVYINAWKTDFADDPLLVVVNSIIEFFKEGAGAGAYDKEVALMSAVYQLSKPLLAALGGALGGVVGGAAGGPAGAITGAVAGKEMADKASGLVGGKSKKSAAESHFENYKLKIGALEQFKEAIQGWVECYMSHPKNDQEYPVLVFVDELDRCRPNYAIELLETVKHMFNLPNFVFVIATDTEQLQHSIKAVYGAGFDSNQYLTRFFDRTFQLPEPNLHDYLNSKEAFPTPDPLEDCNIEPLPDGSIGNLKALVSQMAEAYGLKLRDVDKLMAKLSACFRHIRKRDQGISLNVVCLIHGMIEHQRSSDRFNALPLIARDSEHIINGEVMAGWLKRRPENAIAVKSVVDRSFSLLVRITKFKGQVNSGHESQASREEKQRLYEVTQTESWATEWIHQAVLHRGVKFADWKYMKDLILMSGSFDD